MTTATKAIAGIGGLLATTVVPSTYLAIASSSGNGKETNKRPTGEAWLLSSGYSFNKPTFKSQDNLRHGCVENLFSSTKDSSNPENDSKVYGCAVMRMDLWNTGVLFKKTWETNSRSIDPKWIQFNSEIAIRKGIEGWVINARVDNLFNSSQNSLGYMLTTYKYKDNKWEKNESPKLWMDPEIMNGESLHISSGEKTMEIHNRKLIIKSPKGTWFEDSDWFSKSTDSDAETKKHVKTESWSGAWIDNSSEEASSWIFQDIELFVEEKKYSQVFCKGEEKDCFQPSSSNWGSTRNPGESNTWSNATQGSYNNESAKDVIPKTVKEIISKLKDTKGSWTKLENVCEVNEDPSEEQRQQLKMYCSKGRTSK